MRHVQSVHNGIRLPCDQCNKTFSCRDAVKKHKRRVHDGIFHECAKCGKTFGEKSRLKHHMEARHGMSGLFDSIGMVSSIPETRENSIKSIISEFFDIPFTRQVMFSLCLNS